MVAVVLIPQRNSGFFYVEPILALEKKQNPKTDYRGLSNISPYVVLAVSGIGKFYPSKKIDEWVLEMNS